MARRGAEDQGDVYEDRGEGTAFDVPEGREVSLGNRLVYGAELVTPRMKAEAEIGECVPDAGQAIRHVLRAPSARTMQEAVGWKTQAALAMQVLEAANNIGAAMSGKQPPQLAAAGIQSGSISTLLAQRLAAQRNASRVVQRRVIEVVQPTAAEADSGSMQPIASEANSGDGVSSAADGDGSTEKL